MKDEDTCLEALEEGKCGRTKWMTMCAQTCGVCDAIDEGDMDWDWDDSCWNMKSDDWCANKVEKGKCGTANVARKCQLACGYCEASDEGQDSDDSWDGDWGDNCAPR